MAQRKAGCRAQREDAENVALTVLKHEGMNQPRDAQKGREGGPSVRKARHQW